MTQNVKEKIVDNECMNKCSIKFTRMITEALQTPQQMFNQLKSNNSPSRCSSTRWRKKWPLAKTLSHQNHLRLTSSRHHRFLLLSLLRLPKKKTKMTLLSFRQKVNSLSQRHNAYTITTLHLLIVVIVLPSYHRHHRHQHQWSSQEQEEWRSGRLPTIG